MIAEMLYCNWPKGSHTAVLIITCCPISQSSLEACQHYLHYFWRHSWWHRIYNVVHQLMFMFINVDFWK